MRETGIRLDDDRAVLRFAEEKLAKFHERMSSTVRAKVPEATIFYNTTVNPTMAKVLPYQTHFEIESRHARRYGLAQAKFFVYVRKPGQSTVGGKPTAVEGGFQYERRRGLKARLLCGTIPHVGSLLRYGVLRTTRP